MRTIAAVLVGLLLSTPVFAQKASPADVKTIEACIGKSDDEGGLGMNCVGAIADPCMKKDGLQEEQMKACAARELSVWFLVTDTALKAVKAGGFKDIEAAAQESQKSFAASRDKLCAMFDKVEPGMLSGAGAYCRLQETARRALLLRRLGAAVGEH